MKKLYILFLLSLCKFSYAQDLLIENQAQLDALTPPTSINGNLSIISDGSDDIFDLSSLGSLTTITGSLIIQNNPILSHLDGLSSLTSISGGVITIQDNQNLYSFCGLSGVAGPITETVSGNSYNPSFADIVGANCKAPDVIYNDPNNDRFNTQAEIDALPDGITYITDELVIGLDAATNDITDLSKFSKLREIGGRLLIQRSPLITDLSGFKALEAIGTGSSQELAVREMASLTTLDGLQALRSVSRRIGVWSNPVLKTLEGLDNLKTIKDNASSELIRIGTSGAGGGNPLLEDFCALQGIVDIIGASVLDADALSYINNETTFNPTFQDISNGNCTSIYSGDLTVTTQAEIDALPLKYTSISGKLDILGNDGDISDLSKFNELRNIGGRLLIQDCPLVTDLTGLSSLEIIGSASTQELAVRRMAGLTTLNGLQSLTTVSRRIGFWQNPVLQTLEGLENLQLIRDNTDVGDGLIRIGTSGAGGGNASLTDFCALQGIVAIIGASVLDGDADSYINNETTFNPTFQDIANGNCSTSLSTSQFGNGSYKLYPNPVLDVLKIQSKEKVELIRILNILGREVLISNENEIDLSNLSSGFYLVKIESGNKLTTIKIVKN